MKKHRLFTLTVAVAACAASCGVLPAQEPNCDELSAMARMARAKSSVILTAEKRKAGDSYRAQLVFAARFLELNPKEHHAAARLLNLIPKEEGQQITWITLGSSLCDAEPFSNMRSLGRLRDSLPRDLAKAVLLVPEKLPAYVAYALTSTQDPHSNYAIQMQTVCRAKHAEFMKAVGELPLEKKDWFVKHILNPEGCQALALPEAE